MAERVLIFDTTLRDGEQSPGCSMTVREKRRMAAKLVDLGVDVLEAGFPIASDGDFEAVRIVAGETRGVTVAALARACAADIARAAAALEGAERPRIHTFIATSDNHLDVQAPEDARPGAGRGGRGRAPGAPLRGRRRVLGRGRDAHRRRLPERGHAGRRRRRAPARSTSRTRSATACPTSSAATIAPPGRRWWTAVPPSASTATTTSAWPWPTRWPPCRPARAGRVHGQRHRRARRQLRPRGDRHDPRGPPRLPAVPRRRSTRRSSTPPASCSASLIAFGPQPNKSIVGPQRLRARGRHPPGRRPQGADDLRDHRPGGGRRPREPADPRQAQRAPRPARPAVRASASR